MPIKNIIFDQGGIILNIDYVLTENAFVDLGGIKFAEIYSQKNQSPVFDLYDTGKISSEDFRYIVKKELGLLHISDIQFDNAWNAMLLDLPIHRLEFITKLREKYKVFILSNANDIHMTEANKTFYKITGKNSLSSYFDATYYSHEYGMRKPNEDFFNFVLHEHNLIPQETLFIDDSKQHIEGAKKVGLKTLYHNFGDITETLSNFLSSAM